SGTTDKVVAWSVLEANGGSIAADGTYTAPTTSGTYHVKATSHADPAKSGSAPVTVTGSVAPIVTITASPPSLTNQRGASFSFTSSKAGSTFSCALDAGTAAACTSPKSYSGLATGSHAFMVTATDLAGNVSAPASFAWTITIAAGGLVISSPLTLDKTNVVAGDTLRGTVTYQNTSASPISVQAVTIGG